RGPPQLRRDLLQKLKPFAADPGLERMKAGGVSAWVRQSCDETAPDWIGDLIEHDWNSAGDGLQRRNRGVRVGDEHVGCERNQLLCRRTGAIHISISESVFDRDVSALDPAQVSQGLPKGPEEEPVFRIVFPEGTQEPDMSNTVAPLCIPEQWPE